MQEAQEMTLSEYSIRMLACNLSQIDKEFQIYLAAWANVQAQGLKEGAKFTDLFDYEKAVKEVYNPHTEQEVDPQLLKIAQRVQEFHQLKKKGGNK